VWRTDGRTDRRNCDSICALSIDAVARKKRLKLRVAALYGKPITELPVILCNVGSHSIICHPHKWTCPAVAPANQAGTQFTYPGRMDGWVNLGSLIAAQQTRDCFIASRRPNRYATDSWLCPTLCSRGILFLSCLSVRASVRASLNIVNTLSCRVFDTFSPNLQQWFTMGQRWMLHNLWSKGQGHSRIKYAGNSTFWACWHDVLKSMLDFHQMMCYGTKSQKFKVMEYHMLEPSLHRQRYTVLDVSCQIRLSGLSCKYNTVYLLMSMPPL